MIGISLCDDDNLLNENLISHISTLRPDTAVYSFTSGEALLESDYLFNDIIILDIEMGEKNGIDTAKCLRTGGYEGILIFLTSHTEMVFDSFQVKPYQYIVKPVEKDKLMSVLRDALLELENKRNNFFSAVCGNSTYRIPLADIYFFESQGRIINISTKSGTIRMTGKMSEIEARLKNRFFFRCHKGYLVNMEHIYEFSNCEITLENKQKIILSRLKLNLFKNTFRAFMKGNIKC